MKKRILSLALALSLVLAFIPAAAAIDPPPAGSIPISNRAQLDAIRNNLSGNYHLTNDIDLSDGAWKPIGDYDKRFSGTLDGQGYAIRNLTIKKSESFRTSYGGNYYYAGLFITTSKSAVIKNLGLEDTNIDINESGPVNGVGGIVAYNEGTISSCYITGLISVQVNYISGDCVGGIVGANGAIGGNNADSGTIINCFNAAAISTVGVGGGIAGRNLSIRSIINCYNIGSLKSGTDRGGAIAGANGDGAIVRSSYWNIDGEQAVYNGALSNAEKKGIGGDGMGQATGLSSGQMQNQASFVDWDFDTVWGFLPGVNNGYPVLRVFHPELSPPPPAEAPNLNTADSWAHTGINEAYNKGFIPEELLGNFNYVVTRQEFCRMAVKWVEYATGKSIDAVLTEQRLTRDPGAFTDTSDPDILAASALGITAGTGNNQFTPGGQFTRQQAATMIMNTCRAVGANVGNPPSAGFADMNLADSWAHNGINFVRANGIMSGTGGNNFNPKGTYTIQESIVTFNNIKKDALP